MKTYPTLLLSAAAIQINAPQVGMTDTELIQQRQCPECERLRQERDQALAKCAEMRELITRLSPATSTWRDRINHALATDCGKGWRSPEEWGREIEPTIELLRDVVREEAYTMLGARAANELFRLEKLKESK